MREELLDSNLCVELRNTINETDIFVKDKIENEKYNLTCAIMDRLDTSIYYINEHPRFPEKEDDLIPFMVHCCIIKDAINMLLEKLGLSINNTEYFKDICKKEPFYIQPDEYKGDDKFFEYLRALVFAHPFLTDRAIPKMVNKGEIQYSPYIVTDLYGAFSEDKDTIGAMVYSNKQDMFSINIKFKTLKKYIQDKYQVLNNINNEFKLIIKNKEDSWKQHKVDRSLNNVELLKDIICILNERYIDSSEVEELLTYYTSSSSDFSNDISIKKYRDEIEKILISMCDATDSYDHEKLFNIISPMLNIRLKELYPMMHYQIEKIYCYLNDDCGNTNFGLQQAKLFSKQFAKKWVTIDTDEMSFNEIKMLTTVACYLEHKEMESKYE